VLVEIAAYVLSIRHGGSFLDGPSAHVAARDGAVARELTHAARHWQTVPETLFLHGGFAQLLADVVALAIFAPNVEDATGRLRFALLYLLGGAVALALGVALAPSSTAPALGASGAVAAVLGAYALLYPRARVLSLSLVPFFATVVAVPAVVLLALWFGVQLWLAATGLADPFGGDWGVGYATLAAGFLFGALSVRLFASDVRIAAKRDRTPPQPVY
jgi:membrane associated rhomboid family serine protease